MKMEALGLAKRVDGEGVNRAFHPGALEGPYPTSQRRVLAIHHCLLEVGPGARLIKVKKLLQVKKLSQ